MAEFIVNPRRAPRAPARCRGLVTTVQGRFEAETEDIGTMGCQLVSPQRVRKGDLLQLQVGNAKVRRSLEVAGRVAWVSPQPPWRVGIAFDEGARKAAARWFDELLAAYPGLGGYRRVPDRFRADSTVYLGRPPWFLVDFTADEAMLLRAISSGARLDELRSQLHDRWPAAQRALFSLVTRQAVTFQPSQAVHPEAWKKILSEVEASLAVAELETRAAPRPPPEPAPVDARVAVPDPAPAPEPGARAGDRAVDARWPAPAHEPSPALELPQDPDAAPPEVAAPPGPAPRWAPGAGAARPVPAPDFAGAGGGWRTKRARSPEAQAVFDRALQELDGGSVNGALALLRRALQLAPGDPEIAQALGKLAFKDRPGSP